MYTVNRKENREEEKWRVLVLSWTSGVKGVIIFSLYKCQRALNSVLVSILVYKFKYHLGKAKIVFLYLQ